MKRFLVVTILVLTTAFAIYRIYPYLSDTQRTGQIAKRMQENGIKDIVVPDGTVKLTPEEVAVLRGRLERNVRAAFSRIQPELLIDNRVPGEIAEIYADFVMLNATGSLQDYLARKERSWIKPAYVMVQDDTERAHKAWIFSVAWARGAPLNPETIAILPRYIRGRVVAEEPYPGERVSPRELRSGGWLSQEGSRGYTGYEIMMDVEAPSLDGAEVFDVQLGVLVINDGPQGEWDVIETRYIGLEDGQFTTRPTP